MNFTDSPYEKMMKELPRPYREEVPCKTCRHRFRCKGRCRKRFRALREKQADAWGQTDPER